MQIPFTPNPAAMLMTCVLSLIPVPVLAQHWNGYGGNQGNHTIDSSAIPDSVSPELAWSVSLGQGRSGLVRILIQSDLGG